MEKTRKKILQEIELIEYDGRFNEVVSLSARRPSSSSAPSPLLLPSSCLCTAFLLLLLHTRKVVLSSSPSLFLSSSFLSLSLSLSRALASLCMYGRVSVCIWKRTVGLLQPGSVPPHTQCRCFKALPAYFFLHREGLDLAARALSLCPSVCLCG